MEYQMMQFDGQQNASENPRPAKTSPSTLVSRNVTIAGHRTSVRLEPEMWSGLSDICRRERGTLHEVCTAVAMRKQPETSLTAAIRVFVMAYFRAATTEDGHIKAGHGYGLAISGAAPPAAPKIQQTSPMNSSVMMASGKLNTTRQY
jgi:predicted DNA-binding ribbon-helix-helix protein